MFLSKAEKEIISKKIEIFEEKSGAELVAVISKRSTDYRYIQIFLNICAIFLISLIIVFFTSFSIMQLLQIQLFCFVSLFLLFEKFDNLILYILPKNYKKEKAFQSAQKQFYNLGLHKTKTKQAIMFFVSLDEKYAEIITDSQISKKISNDYWEKIIEDFIKDVRNSTLSNAYLNVIDSCSSILIEKFPIQENDENELPNEVIELR